MPQAPDRFTGLTPDQMCDVFLAEVTRYCGEFCQRSIDYGTRYCELAAAHPPGTRHNSNLYATADGTVYDHTGTGPAGVVSVLPVRRVPGDPYGTYRAVTTGAVPLASLGPVRRSADHPEETWTWERDVYGSGTAAYAKTTLTYGQRGQRWAQRILDQRQEVTAWMQEHARSTAARRGAPSMPDEDVSAFFRRFTPGYSWLGQDLPDPSFVLGTLRVALDRLAGHTGTVHYC